MRGWLRYGAVWAALTAFPAGALEGSVRSLDGAAIPYAFVSLLGADGAFLGYGISEGDGSFRIDGSGARIAVQPPGAERSDGLAVYGHMPRIYDVEGAASADVQLPECGSLVIQAYGPDGALLRWADFEKLGRFGGQFLYYTDLNDRMAEAAVWPVHDGASRAKDNPREMGLPGVMVHPGERGAVQVLYWPVPGYGKVLLRMDDGGRGYGVNRAGETVVIEANVALAETAVKDHALRAARYGVDDAAQLAGFAAALAEAKGQSEAQARAAKADALLAEVLRASDALAVEASKARAAARTEPFSFGVFQGGTYDGRVYGAAKEAGFSLATVLPGWAWCDLSAGKTRGQIDGTLGVSALRSQGFEVKVHGAVWLQGLGILPERAAAMADAELREAMIAQLNGLMTMFDGEIDLWEAINEPANVNTVGMAADEVWRLAREASAAVKAAGKRSLVNNGHEADYGNMYGLYRLDGTPATAEKRSYLAWLDEAAANGALDGFDVIGLQFYPGAHLGERLGGVQGPCMTPAWFADTLERYAAFGKPVHITEFSIPSAHPAGSTAGYWGAGWTGETQADYAGHIAAIALGHGAVESFTWWDVTDAEASVVNGGMMTASGQAKPVFERLTALLASAAR